MAKEIKVLVNVNPDEIIDEALFVLQAEKTIKLLQSIVDGYKKRVLDGENLKGFEIVPGRKSRELTDAGVKVLVKRFGEDAVFVKKLRTWSDLDKLTNEEEKAELISKGLIIYKDGKPQVKVNLD